MSFFEYLKLETIQEQAELQNLPIIRQAISGQVSKNQYIAFLTEAYHHVKHTVPLLMACGAKLPSEKEWLRESIAHYIEEELGHQEWILNDIKVCGGNAEAVRFGKPKLETELMIAYAYDTISRINPVGFFGMVHVLEGTSIQLAMHAANSLEVSLKLPKTAFTYLTSHGALDMEHVEFFSDLVNRLENEEDKASIVHCSKVVYRLYGNIFRGLESVQ